MSLKTHKTTKLIKPESCNYDVWEKIIKLFDKLDFNGDNILDNKELIEISNLHVKNINNKYEELLINIPYVQKLEIDKINKEANEKIEKIKKISNDKIEDINKNKDELDKLSNKEKINKLKDAIQGNKSSIEFWDFYEYMKTRTHDIENITF